MLNGGHISFDLIDELLDVGVSDLVAQVAVEVEGVGLVVDVLFEVEDVCFEGAVGFFGVEGGFGPDADGGGVWGVVDVDGAGVDTVGGEEGVEMCDVGGGEADGSAALFALNDGAFDLGGA